MRLARCHFYGYRTHSPDARCACPDYDNYEYLKYRDNVAYTAYVTAIGQQHCLGVHQHPQPFGKVRMLGLGATGLSATAKTFCRRMRRRGTTKSDSFKVQNDVKR